MKYIELKDLCQGQKLILAWKDDYTQKICLTNMGMNMTLLIIAIANMIGGKIVEI
jgi:hypothetical protein